MEEAALHLTRPSQLEWLTCLANEYRNLLVALEQLIEAGQAARACGCSVQLADSGGPLRAPGKPCFSGLPAPAPFRCFPNNPATYSIPTRSRNSLTV